MSSPTCESEQLKNDGKAGRERVNRTQQRTPGQSRNWVAAGRTQSFHTWGAYSTG